MNKKGTVIIITLLLIIAAVGVTLRMLNDNGSVDYLNIPNVKTSVMGDDGKYHVITADISIEVPGKYFPDLEPNTIKTLVSDVFKNLDYERLSERDNIKYVESEVKNQLGAYFTENKIDNFYVTNFFDGDLNPTSTSAPTETKRSKVMKGLFKNTK